MKKIFTFVVIMILSCTAVISGCSSSGNNKTMEGLAKQAISVTDEYLNLKIDSEEAYDKIKIIADQSDALYEKKSTANEDTQDDYEIYRSIDMLKTYLYGIVFNYDDNSELLEEYDELKSIIE